MIYRIKYVDGAWDLKEQPVIGDVITLSTDNKCHVLQVCRHMDPDTICDYCALPRVLKCRRVDCCATMSDSYVCGIGSQNLQLLDDILEEL